MRYRNPNLGEVALQKSFDALYTRVEAYNRHIVESLSGQLHTEYDLRKLASILDEIFTEDKMSIYGYKSYLSVGCNSDFKITQDSLGIHIGNRTIPIGSLEHAIEIWSFIIPCLPETQQFFNDTLTGMEQEMEKESIIADIIEASAADLVEGYMEQYGIEYTMLQMRNGTYEVIAFPMSGGKGQRFFLHTNSFYEDLDKLRTKLGFDAASEEIQ